MRRTDQIANFTLHMNIGSDIGSMVINCTFRNDSYQK